MLLAIDAGNTNTVFAVLQDGEIRGQWRISTDGQRTADEYVVWLSQLMGISGMALSEIDACIVSSVVPPATFNLRQIGKKFLNFEPLVLGAKDIRLGLDVRVPQPETVGADRLANAVGAHLKYPGDLIVMDFGTATTFDVVGADGAYLGGIIAPGVNLSIEALHMAAAKLPHIVIQRPDKVIGDTTLGAMQSGVYWGYISMIEGMVARIRDEYQKPLKVIATGGLSHLFRHSTDVIEVVDDDLTIAGLLEIYKRNTNNSAKAAE